VDRVTKEMFEVILQKLDKMDGRFDKLEGRFDSLESEVKEFRAEMKDQVKGLDGEMDIIYHKLKSDINDLTPNPGSKYNIVRED
jgi:hypothetical protein